MEPYTSGSPSGGYNVVSQLITYSAPNYSLDASIEDIMAQQMMQITFVQIIFALILK